MTLDFKIFARLLTYENFLVPVESGTRRILREDVRDIILAPNEPYFEVPFLDLLPNEVKPNVHVLRSPFRRRVLRDENRTHVVDEQRCRCN